MIGGIFDPGSVRVIVPIVLAISTALLANPAYSSFNEAIGSNAAARRAGRYLAASAITASSAMAIASVAGSRGFSPNSSALAALPAARESTAPTASPAVSSLAALSRIITVTSLRRAPSAMRMPI